MRGKFEDELIVQSMSLNKAAIYPACERQARSAWNTTASGLRELDVSEPTGESEKTGATLLPRTGADGSYSAFRYSTKGGPISRSAR
jgi:hypothetical protein